MDHEAAMEEPSPLILQLFNVFTFEQSSFPDAATKSLLILQQDWLHTAFEIDIEHRDDAPLLAADGFAHWVRRLAFHILRWFVFAQALERAVPDATAGGQFTKRHFTNY